MYFYAGYMFVYVHSPPSIRFDPTHFQNIAVISTVYVLIPLVLSPAAHALNEREGVWYTSTTFLEFGDIFLANCSILLTSQIENINIIWKLQTKTRLYLAVVSGSTKSFFEVRIPYSNFSLGVAKFVREFLVGSDSGAMKLCTVCVVNGPLTI